MALNKLDEEEARLSLETFKQLEDFLDEEENKDNS
jgi:hydrogenase maturation factor